VDETAGTVALVFGTVAAGDPPVITNEIEVTDDVELRWDWPCLNMKS
jgi:hypothetical protein